MNTNSYSQAIRLLFLLIMFSILCFDSVDAKNIKHCRDLDDKRVIVVEDPKPISRNLQAISNVHGFRIKFLDAPVAASVDFGPIKNMLTIGSAFFKQLLKVTDVADSTKYTGDQNCGPTITPTSIYATNGFSFSQADLIVSTLIENTTKQGYIAYASSCVVRTWPQYGYIGLNLAYFKASPTPSAQWQSNFMTLIHEATHILSLGSDLFGRFRKSYMSSEFIPQCEVITTYNNRMFVTTPNVKAWAQKHYGCDQSSIGALLEQEGGSGSVGNHWERATTLDDYMNSADFTGNQVTPLTLHLFKDTGYYYDVDFSIASNIQFGKNKGCQFARGLLSPSVPQFCSSNKSVQGFSPILDFYGFYGGQCDKTSDSSNFSLVLAFGNFVCYDSSMQITGTTKNVYGSSSRSFYANISSQKNGFYCFQAKCLNSNTVQIKISGVTGTCTRGGPSTIVIGGDTVYCPESFDRFCSRQKCSDHCSAQGFCSQGSCLSNTLCSGIHSQCIRCKGTTCTGCNYPLFPTGTSSPACDTCTNINASCTSGCQVTQDGRTICKQVVSVPPIIGVCSTCIAVLWCETCSSDTNGTNCITCKSDSNGKPRYPTLDKQSCKTCGQFITDCTTCSVTNGNAICSLCSSPLVPTMSGTMCGAGSTACKIPQCSTCSNAGQMNEICTVCLKDSSTNQAQYPTQDGKTCKTCGQFISNCTTCSVFSGVAFCFACTSPLVPNHLKSACIDNCTNNQCSSCINSGTLNERCFECQNQFSSNMPQYPNYLGRQCRMCSQFIYNCKTCQVIYGRAKCNVCESPYIPKNGGIACGRKVCNIADCATCINPKTANEICQTCINDPSTNQPQYPDPRGSSCKKCGQLIPNCSICRFRSGVVSCIS